VTDSGSTVVNITAVNDAPVNTVPGSFDTTNNVDHATTGLSVSDPDPTSLTTVLHVDHGTLAVAAIGGASIAGSGTATVTLTGSAAQIDAALAAANNVLYHSVSGYFGADHLTMTSNDGGGTGIVGTLSDTDTVAIQVYVRDHAFRNESFDFTSDGKADILWHNDGGAVAIWGMNDSSIAGNTTYGPVSTDWKIAGSADFSGDGTADMLWRNDNGAVAVWDFVGSAITGYNLLQAPMDWKVAGTGDFSGDTTADILWRNDNGTVAT
jgi:hypothetical protein